MRLRLQALQMQKTVSSNTACQNHQIFLSLYISLFAELQTAKSTSLSSSCHRFDVAMAIADLIFELSEVMGWNIKILNIENDTVEKNTQEKGERFLRLVILLGFTCIVLCFR